MSDVILTIIGWMPGGLNTEPTNTRNDRCLYLKNSFKHPDTSRGLVNVNYLFWDDEFCKRTKRKFRKGFNYMCEKPRQKAEAKEKGIVR